MSGRKRETPGTPDAHEAVVQRRIAAALRQLILDAPSMAPHPYLRRHLVDHAARGNALDNDHVPAELLPWELSGRIRGFLGLPVSNDHARGSLGAWAGIEPFLGDAAAESRALSLSFARVAANQNRGGDFVHPCGLRVRWAHWAISGNVLAYTDSSIDSVAAVPVSGARVLLATGSADGVIRLWDPVKGTAVGDPLIGHPGPVVALAAVSLADGRALLASGGGDDMIRLWDPSTGSEVGTLQGHTDRVRALAVVPGPEHGLLASGDGQGVVRLWNPLRMEEVRPPLHRHTDSVRALAAVRSADGQVLLASASADRRVAVWDLAAGRATTWMRGHVDGVTALAFVPLPSGRVQLASGSVDGTVRLWNPSTGARVGEPLVGHTGHVQALATMQVNGRVVLASGSRGTVRLWNPVTRTPRGNRLTGHIDAVTSLAALPLEGRALLASGGTDGTVRLWDGQASSVRTDVLAGSARAVTALATVRVPGAPEVGSALVVSGGADGTIRFWDASTGDVVGARLTGHAGAVTALAVSRLADGRMVLASGGVDGTVRWWDPVARTAMSGRSSGHTGPVTALAALRLSDGRALLASGDMDGKIRLWDPATGSLRADRTAGSGSPVTALAVMPLSKGRIVVAAAHVDGAVWMVDPVSGPAASPSIMCDAMVTALAPLVVRSERTMLALATADGTVRLWDPAACEYAGDALAGHVGSVTSLVAVPAPDGKRLLASSGRDCTIRLWDPSTGTEVARLITGGPVEALCAESIARDLGRLAFAGPTGLALIDSGDVPGERATSIPGAPAELTVNFDSAILDRHSGRLLSPDDGKPKPGHAKFAPTTYREDTLLVPVELARDPAIIDRFNAVLMSIGCELVVALPTTDSWRLARATLNPRLAVPVVIRPRRGAGNGAKVDAWTVLSALRGAVPARDLRGVGLEHLLRSASTGGGGVPYGGGLPYGGGVPFGGGIPFGRTGVPYGSGIPFGSGIPHRQDPAAGDEGQALATAGRSPVRVFSPQPMRRAPGALRGERRQVVALVDSGVGHHPWLRVGHVEEDPVVEISHQFQNLLADQQAAIDDARGSTGPPLRSPFDEGDGAQPNDTHSGHGTFAAGLVFQNSPDARVLSLRVSHSDGVCGEASLLLALDWLRARVQQAIDDGRPDLLVDVVSLSMGFYPESYESAANGALAEALQKLTYLGVVVIAAAGNDATTRQFVPAALGIDAGRDGRGNPLVVAVGALNAAGKTIAVFSNEGDWVTRWAPGDALVSTVPIGRPESAYLSSVDSSRPASAFPLMDDGPEPPSWTGFEIWSGTSFAAPVLAGMAAERLAEMPDQIDRAKRYKRAVGVLSKVDRDLSVGRDAEWHDSLDPRDNDHENGPSVGIRNAVGLFVPRPYRRPPSELPAGRRPVVAVVDTGIGPHPWLTVDTADDPVVEVSAEFQSLFDTFEADRATRMTEVRASTAETYSGHGTFAAGLVHQNCPDARLLSLRVIRNDGVFAGESVLLALEWLRERVQTALDNGRPDKLIDVVSLSLGFHPDHVDYHTGVLLAHAVESLTDLGVVIVAVAGNDATTEHTVPAALGVDPNGVHVSNPLFLAVGTLNAEGHSLAAFSNEGDWVTRWAPGDSIVSTVPLRPGYDDLATGFAAWTGASFAAPVVAGMVAHNLIRQPDSPDVSTRPLRALLAVEATDHDLTDLGWM